MAFSYESEFIFIGRGDESFLENYSYELSDDPDGKAGRIFMAAEIINNQAEAEDIGEAIFSNFKQAFYENQSADPYDRFEAALKYANAVLETLKEEKISRFIGNFNIAIAAIADNTLYISTTGDAEVYLVRKRFVSIISEGLAEESKKETFINIANGELEPGDSVVISSSRLLRYITKRELGRLFSDIMPGEMSKALAQLQDLIMTEILGRSAVIGCAVANEEAGSEKEKEEENLAEITESRFNAAISLFKKYLPFIKSIELPRLGLLEKFSSLTAKFERPRPRMTRERILLTAAVLLIVLVGGIFWLKTRGSTKRAIAEQKAKLNHVAELINDAVTVGQFDKTKASELLAAGEKEAVEVLGSKFLRGEAVKTLDEIQQSRDNLDDVKRIANPTLLADFSEKRATVSSLGVLHLKDRLFGFEYNALYEIVLDKLQDPLTINDVETVILGTDFIDQSSLLFLTRTGKMIEYSGGRFNFIPTKDGIWKKGNDMKSYHDRVYILDSERNQIWRYIRRREGFDAGEQYNQNADLKNGVSLAIDSSVYVLNSDGTVTQLYQGQKQEYPLRKAPLNSLSAPTKIFTNPDLNHIYILEPSKQRVVVFRKDPKNSGAQYQTQYIFEKVGVLRDLLVSDNRLYIMDDKRVYFVNLSGL